jgi:hypothetical protein
MKSGIYRYALPLLILIGVLVTIIVLVGKTETSTSNDNTKQIPNPEITNTPDNSSKVSQATNACSNPVTQPDAKKVAADQPEKFAWSLFLYFNCPTQSNQPSPLIWETWRPTYTVYLKGGQTPSPWGSPLPPRMLSGNPEISGFTLKDKAGQPVLYEIGMNEATFNYILQRELYSLAGQVKFFSDPTAPPIDFPPDAVEVKAAWVALGPNDIASRYYTIHTEEYGLIGLAGFHITSKILPTWFWATFEQKDNESVTGVPQLVPTPQSVMDLNKKVHAELPANSPWQYYDLRGAQIAFTDANNQPTVLANTLIETNFQKSSSCITCHGLASRGDESDGHLGFFNNTPDGIVGYVGAITDPQNKYYDPYDNPVCFNTQKRGFVTCDSSEKVVYKLTDFVWSLSEAH